MTITQNIHAIADNLRRLGRLLPLPVAMLFLAALLAGCNTPTKAIDDTANSQEGNSANAEASDTGTDGSDAADDTETAAAKIIRQPSTVSRKGTNIRAVVNGDPISSFDVNRRAAFLKLRRVGGNRSAKALEELTEEKIKMQEAKRRNTVASNSEVDESFARFAKSNRMSTSQLSNVLSRAGVTSDHFKEFIRTQISWSRTVGAKLRSEASTRSAQQTMSAIRDAGGQKPETNEYLLEQVIFVVPQDRRKAILKQRRAEASAFRERFTACGETVKQAATVRDVTVRTLRRTLEPQLPPEWKEELIKTPEGGTTSIKDTDRGVEFLAVCSKRSTSDDAAARVVEQEKQFEEFNDKGDELSKSFLAELKSKSKIIYR